MTLTVAAEAYRKAKQAEMAAVEREAAATREREESERKSNDARMNLLLAATAPVKP